MCGRGRIIHANVVLDMCSGTVTGGGAPVHLAALVCKCTQLLLLGPCNCSTAVAQLPHAAVAAGLMLDA
jgi:hypothetical protein